MIIWEEFYDTNGAVIDTFNYFTDSVYTANFANGKIKVKLPVVNGYLHGKAFDRHFVSCPLRQSVNGRSAFSPFSSINLTIIITRLFLSL